MTKFHHHITKLTWLCKQILPKCKTFSVEAQLTHKRLRWFGNMCRMLDTRLPKLMPHGQVTGPNCRGKPRTVWNDVVLSDVQLLKLNHYRRDAQNKPVWRELTCVAHTWAWYDGKANVLLIIIIRLLEVVLAIAHDQAPGLCGVLYPSQEESLFLQLCCIDCCWSPGWRC